MAPIEPDWILKPGRIDSGGWSDPDMAHRRGVKVVKPPSIWRRFTRWLNQESDFERQLWRGCCKLVDSFTGALVPDFSRVAL